MNLYIYFTQLEPVLWHGLRASTNLGSIVGRLISANPELNFNPGFITALLKSLLHTDPNSLPYFNERGLRSFLQEVNKYNMAMIKKVEASEILKGISKEGIKEIAKEVKLSPGCLNVLNHINLPLHLISVNWCQELIFLE